MKAIIFKALGGPDVLETVEQPVAEPSPGEVVVRVTSVGLNRADLLFAAGRYFQRATLPSRVGMEVAGIVEATGERVGVLPSSMDISKQGGMAEYVTVARSSLVPTPAAIPDADAAAIWMQYLTVWGALNYTVKTQPGQFVVITAASSSVGLAAIELVKLWGGVPIATTTSADKVDRLRAHGADHVIDMKSENYAARVQEITGGRGVDYVFDAVGGPGISEHVRACRQGASIFLYGLLDVRPLDLNGGWLIGKQVRLIGYTIRSVMADATALSEAVRGITDGIQSGRLHPVIDRRFPMNQAREAFEYMASNRQFGKIVVTAWES